MLSNDDAKNALLIFNLLKTATNQQKFKEFLKSKNVPISASNWDDLYTRRLHPAMVEGKISLNDLRDLLRDAEEYGRQHIFLYKCKNETAKSIINQNRLHVVLKELGIIGLLTTPIDLDMPTAPTIVEIREIAATTDCPHRSLVVKQVETRTTRVYRGEFVNAAEKTVSKVYDFEEKRAINIVRLYENGLLELRINSRDNSTNYTQNIKSLFGSVSKIIPPAGFNEISLDVAKNKLIEQRDELADEVRFVKSTAKNDFGVIMDLSCATQDDSICEDNGSTGALEKFLENDAQISGTNIYLKIIDGTETPNELHVLISGAKNEFAIPVPCSSEDYEYVFAKILELNE